ncbi:hypothetical protein Tco_1067377 [Tanacetum coccineum]|uniref:Uncharacterized protein n=1 Tax=Tanacetum coccineum TaxID=301880 RepID=A0ABQ5HDA3_9ASTR
MNTQYGVLRSLRSIRRIGKSDTAYNGYVVFNGYGKAKGIYMAYTCNEYVVWGLKVFRFQKSTMPYSETEYVVLVFTNLDKKTSNTSITLKAVRCQNQALLPTITAMKNPSFIRKENISRRTLPNGDQSGPLLSPVPKTWHKMAAKGIRKELKSILLLAIPDEYLLKFHNVPDAKSL